MTLQPTSDRTQHILIASPCPESAESIGQLLRRSGASSATQKVAPVPDGDEIGSCDAIFVTECAIAEWGLLERGLRTVYPPGLPIVGIVRSPIVESSTLFSAGFDLLLYEPLVQADIERALAFAEAIRDETPRQARERLRKMTAMHELAIASAHQTGTDDWVGRMVRVGRDVLGSDALAMWALDRDAGCLHCIGSAGLSSEYIAFAEQHSPMLVEHYDELPRHLSTHWLSEEEATQAFRIIAPEAARAEGIRKIAWVPVRDANQLFGHLSFYFHSDDAFERYDLVLADAFSSIVAASLSTNRLQSEIRRTNRLYREHVESSPNGVVVCLPDGSIERSNYAMEQISGRDRYEIIGKPVFDWIMPPDVLPWEEWLALNPDESPQPVERWLSRPSGERRRVSCYGRRLLLPDPITLEETEERIQIVMEDVTEQGRRLVELELFHDLSRIISERRSLIDAYEVIVDRLYKYLNYRFVAIGEVHDGRVIELQTFRTHMADVVIPTFLGIDSGLCGLAVRENRSVLTCNVSESPHYYDIDSCVTSELVAIVRANGKPVGVIDIQTDATQPLDEGDMQLANSIAAHLGLLIEQVQMQRRLERQALTDPLTGMANRRSFLRELQKLIQDPEGEPAGLLLVELDHFKQINDRYGHLFGDEMLKQVARRLRETLREQDLLARYGGDEIAVIFRGLSADGAFEIAERLRGVIDGRPFEHNGTSVSLTVSIGISLYPLHGTTTDALIGEADRAMYAAKLEGRNSVSADFTMVG